MGCKNSKGSSDVVVATRAHTSQDETKVISELQRNTLLIEDARLTESTTIEYEGPVTTQQLQQEALEENQLFLVFFPSENDEVAYLDTVQKTLSFQELPSQTDLSILMRLQTTGPAFARDPQYRWSTVVTPEDYYTVTRASLRGGSRLVVFSEYDTIRDIPTWEAEANSEDRLRIAFKQTDSNEETWYLNPVVTGPDRQVIGTTDEPGTARAHVYHVTSHDANTIPFADIEPINDVEPPADGNSEADP